MRIQGEIAIKNEHDYELERFFTVWASEGFLGEKLNNFLVDFIE